MGYGGLNRSQRLELYAIALYYADLTASLQNGHSWLIWELAPEYIKEMYLDRADRHEEEPGLLTNTEAIIRSINNVLDY